MAGERLGVLRWLGGSGGVIGTGGESRSARSTVMTVRGALGRARSHWDLR